MLFRRKGSPSSNVKGKTRSIGTHTPTGGFCHQDQTCRVLRVNASLDSDSFRRAVNSEWFNDKIGRIMFIRNQIMVVSIEVAVQFSNGQIDRTGVCDQVVVLHLNGTITHSIVIFELNQVNCTKRVHESQACTVTGDIKLQNLICGITVICHGTVKVDKDCFRKWITTVLDTKFGPHRGGDGMSQQNIGSIRHKNFCRA